MPSKIIDYSKRNTWKGGRKRKPTAAKAAAGTLRPCRENDDEPAGQPLQSSKPPSRMSKQGKAAWKYLVPPLEAMRILTESDLPALEVLCNAWAEYQACEKELKNGDYVITTAGGNDAINPIVSVRDRAWQRFHKVELEFGMTPASRPKVSTVKADEQKEQNIKAAFFN